MYSINSSMFKVGRALDQNGQYKDMLFELIKDPVETVPSAQLTKLKGELLSLYQEREWLVPISEVIESLESASLLIALKIKGKLCGFFTGRNFQASSPGDFFYLERLIISRDVPLRIAVLMASLLVFNLPGLGKKELIISSITRLKFIGTLVELFGDSYFCSSTCWPTDPYTKTRAEAILNALSCEKLFELNSDGILKDVFHCSFNHNRDNRLISSRTPLGEHDAVLVMNRVPAGENNFFSCLQNSSVTKESLLIKRLVELWEGDKLFTKIKVNY